MRSTLCLSTVVFIAFITACSTDVTSPAASPASQVSSLVAGPWGPETPPFNNEIILRGDGFGHIKFRQPNDGNRIVYLDTWVRDLAPNTAYRLQRAVDANVDDDCTSTSWLTLGKGTVAQAIVTDENGTGREDLWRDLGAFAPGATFDIHFRLINATTSAVVLTSDCYQFVVSQ